MPVVITRRWFLVGSAAAVATAAVGLPTLEPVASAPLRHAVGPIGVYDITITPNGVAADMPVLTFEMDRLIRSSEYPLLRFSINPTGAFTWSGLEDFNTFIVLPGDALRILCTPDPGGDATAIVCYVDSERRHFVDRFEWRDGAAVVVDSQPMNASP